MEVIKAESGAIKICPCCKSILNYSGDDVKVEKKKFMSTTRVIVCPVCKLQISLD